MIYSANLSTPLGIISLYANEDCLFEIAFGKCRETAANAVIMQAAEQLSEYFEKKRTKFELPLEISGTDFQKRVWQELLKIPYGTTISYAELAERAGNKKACRAAGSANGKNRLPIVIPCHRVISSDGKIGGYSGGLFVKRMLLEIEGITDIQEK